MNSICRFFAVIVLLVVLMASTTVSAFAQDPANGKVVWEEQTFCQRCHGPAGEGLWAGPLAGTEKTADEFIDQVRNPRRNMPSFSAEQVSDQQIIDINAYMASLSEPDSFTPQDAGLPADAPQGQMLIVEKRCVACHSPTGPLQPFVDRGEMPTAEAVITQVRNPKNFMPSFSADQVSDAELTLIAEFLAAQFAGQAPPDSLPTSGSSLPAQWPIALAFTGFGLVLGGFALRKYRAR